MVNRGQMVVGKQSHKESHKVNPSPKGMLQSKTESYRVMLHWCNVVLFSCTEDRVCYPTLSVLYHGYLRYTTSRCHYYAQGNLLCYNTGTQETLNVG